MELLARNSIVGSIKNRAKLTGKVTISTVIGVVPDYYDGPYEVIPSATEQILESSEKTFKSNLVIKPIPYREIENEFGGTTVEIG